MVRRRPQPDIDNWQSQLAGSEKQLYDLERNAAELRARLDEAKEFGASTSELRRQLAGIEASIKMARRQFEEQQGVIRAVTSCRLSDVINGLLGDATRPNDKPRTRRRHYGGSK